MILPLEEYRSLRKLHLLCVIPDEYHSDEQSTYLPVKFLVLYSCESDPISIANNTFYS